MPTRIMPVALFVCAAMIPSRAAGQTAPLPAAWSGDATGFLTRAAWLFSIAGMQSGDVRFSEVARSRADVDVGAYAKGRVIFLFDAEFVMGSERRAFDLNHENITFETSASYRIAPFEVAAVGRHVSRHLVDRPFDVSVVAWHTLGGRAEGVFGGRQTRVAS